MTAYKRGVVQKDRLTELKVSSALWTHYVQKLFKMQVYLILVVESSCRHEVLCDPKEKQRSVKSVLLVYW